MKTSNISTSVNGSVKRNASQAAAATSNLPEGVRDSIYVSLQCNAKDR